MSSSAHNRIVVYSHSPLFYWWPVWAAGFVMAIVSYFGDQWLAIVPAGTVAKREALVAPGGKNMPVDEASQELIQPHLRVSSSKNVGVLFCTILLLVLFCTNVPSRGWALVFVILILIFLSVIFAVVGWWEPILSHVSSLDIRINMGGYLFISTGLFTVWVIVTFLFDRQIYAEFTPGAFNMVYDIGAGVHACPTLGMAVSKRRSGLFRHTILGFGSGDLIIKPPGEPAIELPNVLFAGRRDKQINDMLAAPIPCQNLAGPDAQVCGDTALPDARELPRYRQKYRKVEINGLVDYTDTDVSGRRVLRKPHPPREEDE